MIECCSIEFGLLEFGLSEICALELGWPHAAGSRFRELALGLGSWLGQCCETSRLALDIACRVPIGVAFETAERALEAFAVPAMRQMGGGRIILGVT